MSEKPQDQPLLVVVKSNRLVISIGIDTLAFAQQVVIDNEDFHSSNAFVIKDAKQFAEDVVGELLKEREDGSSILTDLIDLAGRRAVDNGSTSGDHLRKIPYQLRKWSIV